MSKNLPRVVLCFALTLSLSAGEDQEHDLETGMTSWARMKRDAGYYTESGIWRGGLWRVASNTEEERYECRRENVTHCTEWTSYEENKKKRETGKCTCLPTESSYCREWNCTSEHVDKNADCRSKGESTVCYDRVLQDTLDCNCTVESKNERYCHAWHCVDASSTGYSEEEDYECLMEDVTQEYCYRWRGNISSSFEIESSVCECFERGRRFCAVWECRERALIRCAAHEGGWCSLEIALGVGGGLGAVYFLAFLSVFAYYKSVDEWMDSWVEGCPCTLFVFAPCLPFFFSAFLFTFVELLSPADKPHLRTVIAVSLGFLFLNGPWIIGLLIWGGVRALLYMIPVWISMIMTFLFMRCYRYCKEHRKDRRIHPSNQV